MLSNIYIWKLHDNDMDTSVLEDIGFSPVEIKVFIAILETGEAKAGKIIEKTGLQSSSVYNAINILIKKGFVSYIKKSQIKYYRAVSPETILNYIDSKKRDYLKILPELKERQKKNENEGVEFFKSFKGIRTLITELLSDAKKGNVYRFFSVEDMDEYEISRQKVFQFVKQIIKEKKIDARGIFHEKTRYPRTGSSIIKKKYLASPLPPNTMVFNGKIAIISWDKEPSGILLYSENIARNYENFFEHMWKIAHK